MRPQDATTPWGAAFLTRMWMGKSGIRWGVILFCMGLLLRVALVMLRTPGDVPHWETFRIAQSLATKGSYAGAFGDSGPSAHCAPLLPLLQAIPIRMFGPTPRATLAINIMGSASSALGYALLPTLAVASGLGIVPGIVAGLAGELIPINFMAQTSGVADASYAFFFVNVLSIVMCRAWGAFPPRQALKTGLVMGLACLMNAGILQIFVAWAAVAALRCPLRRVVPFFGIAGLVAACVMTPWAIRNYIALGSPIFTRTNFGLELYMSNNDYMTAEESVNVKSQAFHVLHPSDSGVELALVRTLGEVAYSEGKKRQALAWIEQHKERFLALSTQRVALFWFPHMLRLWQTCLEAAMTLLALAGAIVMFRKRNPFVWPLTAAAVGYSLVYIIIQTSPRYRFPVEGIILVLGSALLDRRRPRPLHNGREPLTPFCDDKKR